MSATGEPPPRPAFISLGSNVDPERNLPRAVAELASLGPIRAVSRAYESPAVGPPGQPDFVNAAVLLLTNLEAAELRAGLRRIEERLDRRRSPDRYAPRTIDLDLCLLGSLIVRGPELTLPDPEIPRRAYLAVTLAELDPEFPHPTTGETLREIADRVRAGAILRERPDIRLRPPG